jgi:hypothetical protein
MSDGPSDTNIEFVYFGLRERVIGIGFAMVCLRGFRLGLLLDCDASVGSV